MLVEGARAVCLFACLMLARVCLGERLSVCLLVVCKHLSCSNACGPLGSCAAACFLSCRLRWCILVSLAVFQVLLVAVG